MLADFGSPKNVVRPPFTGFQRTSIVDVSPSFAILPERSIMKTRLIGASAAPAFDVAHADLGSTLPTFPAVPLPLPLPPLAPLGSPLPVNVPPLLAPVPAPFPLASPNWLSSLDPHPAKTTAPTS